MIEEYKFGSFRISGKNYLDDIKIINGKARSTNLIDYRKGLTLEDVKDIVNIKPKVCIIGNGASGLLLVNKDVKDFLRSQGVQLIIERTPDAVNTVNKMFKEKKDFAAYLKATS